MGDDSCPQDRAVDSKQGFVGKKVRPDQPASPADSTVRSPHEKGRDQGEICARYCDRASLTENQRGLAVRYIPLAQAMVRRAARLGTAEGEELQSAAYLALVEAALTFDPSRKVNFATFARYRIRGALRDCQRWLAAGWRGDPAHQPAFQSLRDNVEEFGRVLGPEQGPPVGAEIESTEAVEKWLRRLPRAHAAACRLIYLHNKSQDEAAALLGCSKSYMSRLHREAISRLIQDYHEASGPQSPACPAEET